jgi:hypothetical protein
LPSPCPTNPIFSLCLGLTDEEDDHHHAEEEEEERLEAGAVVGRQRVDPQFFTPIAVGHI